MKAATKSKLTRLTIARLYNMGNYEHVRYELTCEIPPDGSAKQTALDMAAVLAALKPIRKDYLVEQALAVTRKEQSALTEYEKDHLAEYQEKVAAYEFLRARKDWALNKLDELGGTSVKTDAKKDWRDDDDDLF